MSMRSISKFAAFLSDDEIRFQMAIPEPAAPWATFAKCGSCRSGCNVTERGTVPYCPFRSQCGLWDATVRVLAKELSAVEQIQPQDVVANDNVPMPAYQVPAEQVQMRASR